MQLLRTDRFAKPPRTLALFGLGLLLCLTLHTLGIDSAQAQDAATEATKAAEATGTAATTGDGKSWGAFIGRLHVVVLHLPIGLIIGAFIIEFFGLFRRSKGYDIAAAWLFVFGALASIVAVVTGMLYGTEWAADNSGKEPMNVWQLLFADSIEQGVTETMGWHMWLGITLMVAAIVAAVLKVMAVRKQWPEDPDVAARGGWPLGVSRLAMVAAMVALPFAGHLGGNMTHGPEKLFARAPFDVPDSVVYWPEVVEVDKTKPVPGGSDLQLVKQGTVAFWNAKIQPVLDNHCTACHNAGKQNGKLRLDSLEWAMKGGSIGGTIDPGDAEFSEIYRRVILPPSHDEFMPTNVRKYGMMSQENIHLLGEWLTEFDGNLDDGSAAEITQKTPQPEEKDPEPAKPLIDPAAIRAIEDAGGSAQSLSLEQDPDLLTVKFAYLKTLDPEAVAKLSNTSDQVAWLTFEGSGFNDTAAQQLPAMPRLTNLNLKDTAVTDTGLAAMPEFPKLEWLNLFGTQTTDDAVDSLKRYTSLKKLYVTGTAMTEAGVKALRDALPGTEVFSDFDSEFQFTPVPETPTEDTPADETEGDTEDENQDKPEDEPEDKPANATADAKPVNAKCPVSGAPIDAGQFVIYKDKKVAFCCGNCKAKFEKEPEKFARKLQ